jgi:hypothetical protein
LGTKEFAVATRQRTGSRFLLTWEFFTKKNMIVVPHSPHVSLFPSLKIKLKDHNLDTTEVIVAESQAMLNTLTEHDIQDAFKKRQMRWERYIRAEGDYFEGDCGQ